MKHAKTSRVFSLLALVLAVTMLLTLVGCGGDNAGDDTTKTTTTTTTTTVADNGNTDATTGGDATTDDTTIVGDETLPSLDIVITQGTQASKTTKTNKVTTKTQPVGDKNVLNQAAAKLKGAKLPNGKPLKEIYMLIWWTLPAEGTDAYQKNDDVRESAAFKAATGIEVKYETAVMDKYQSTLSGKIMAGNPPALAAIINEWYPQPITRGLMQPISVTGWDYSDKSLYSHDIMDQFGYKGTHYGIALQGSNMTTFEVMFFNKKSLKANGIAIGTEANNWKDGGDPYSLWKQGKWNWDTCKEIAQKCNNPKKEKYGMTLIYQTYWMLSAGQDFVLSEKTGLKNNLSSPQLLTAWKQAWDMVKGIKVIPDMFNNQQTLFFDGSVAMLGAGSYMMQADASHQNYVPQNCTAFEWDVVPFPSPKGASAVAGCEGTVWGFPAKVKGDTLQAAMWYLRYYLDDSTYSARDFYPDDKLGTHCWDVMGWMWNQKIRSYNSVGVLTFGGKYTSTTIQYKLIDEADNPDQISPNLVEWATEIDANIKAIVDEME